MTCKHNIPKNKCTFCWDENYIDKAIEGFKKNYELGGNFVDTKHQGFSRDEKKMEDWLKSTLEKVVESERSRKEDDKKEMFGNMTADLIYEISDDGGDTKLFERTVNRWLDRYPEYKAKKGKHE